MCVRACVHTGACVCVATSVTSDSLQPYGLLPNRVLYPWDSPGKNIGMGCHSILQGIFPTLGSNLTSLIDLWHWQEGSLPLVPHGKPRYTLQICKYIQKREIFYKEMTSNLLLQHWWRIYQPSRWKEYHLLNYEIKMTRRGGKFRTQPLLCM